MKLDIEKLHHAYLLEGERKSLLAELFEFVEKKLNVKRQGNPDFYVGEFDVLSIDDGRMLKELQVNKVREDGRRILIVAFNGITREAQNSLLKIFEEPNERTHFFIITPSAALLLPTLLSRVMRVEGDSAQLETREAEKFLKMSKGDRIQFIKELMEDISDEKKTKHEGVEFLHQLEKVLYSKFNVHKATPEERFSLEQVVKVSDFANDRSASLKMILEHLALSV